MSKFRYVAAGLLAAVVMSLWAVAPASAAPTSQVRMRHLASDVPPVDLYMAGLNGQYKLMLRGLAFGQTSPYLSVEPGTYAVALRPAGAPAASAPAVKGTVEVGQGKAYTFQATGTLNDLEQKLLVDGPAGVAASAQPGVLVSPAPQQLAVTGTGIDVAAAAGVLFVAAGVVLVATGRRRAVV